MIGATSIENGDANIVLPAAQRGSLLDCFREVENILSFKIALLADVVDIAKSFSFFLAKQIEDLLRSPNIEFSFFALAIGIFGAMKSS